MITKKQFKDACAKFKPNALTVFMFKYFSTDTADEDKWVVKWLVGVLVAMFILGFLGTVVGVPKVWIGIPTLSYTALLVMVGILKFYTKIANNLRIRKIMAELNITTKLEYESLMEKYVL